MRERNREKDLKKTQREILKKTEKQEQNVPN